MKGLTGLSASIEAFLFARGNPVSLSELGEALGEDTVTVEKALHLLEEKYTKKVYDSWLSSLLGKQTPLSPAAMETLAVVACREPVTRAEIEKIRGVSAGRVISLLMDKDLIEERGRLDVPGRPILYGTTKRFLQCTGLTDVNELKTRWSEKLDEGDLF